MIQIAHFLFKLTGWIPFMLIFRTKAYYEDKSVQSRRIKGAAIIISNHTSVYDFIGMVFMFLGRTLRYQMAEVLFRKKVLGPILRLMGGIYVDRNTYDFSFVKKSVDILKKKGVVGIFPESRLAVEGEERPLPFKTSAIYTALESGAPIIPVYTNGCYFCKKRAAMIIGTPIKAVDLWDDSQDEKTNVSRITELVRQKVIELGEELQKQEG